MVSATGLRIAFDNGGVNCDCNHYHVYEFEAYYEDYPPVTTIEHQQFWPHRHLSDQPGVAVAQKIGKRRVDRTRCGHGPRQVERADRQNDHECGGA